METRHGYGRLWNGPLLLAGSKLLFGTFCTVLCLSEEMPPERTVLDISWESLRGDPWSRQMLRYNDISGKRGEVIFH